MNYLRQLRDIILFILLVWGVILLGIFLVDAIIVPLPSFLPQFPILFVSILQVGITSALIILFLFVWDRLLAYYYKVNWEKRKKKE